MTGIVGYENNNPPLWSTSFLINKNSISRIPDFKVYLSNIGYKTFQYGLYCFPNSQYIGNDNSVVLKGFRFLIFVLEWNLNEDKSNTH